MKPNNPLAFPVPFCPIKEEGHGHSYDDDQGMTLRDYFAAKASDKDIENFEYYPDESSMPSKLKRRTREAARFAFADAMLSERDK